MDVDDFAKVARELFPTAQLTITREPVPDAAANAVGGAARRASATASLDLWTHRRPPGPHLELNMANCGNSQTETSVIVRPEKYRPMAPRKRARDSDRSARTKRTEMTDDDILRSGRRAVKRVRQSAKVMGADRILTLTSRKYLYSMELCWEAFGEFNRLMKREFRRWQYIAVPELHPKHSDHYHIHCAIHGRYPVNDVRRIWKAALRATIRDAVTDHSPGNIDIAYKRQNRWHPVNGIAKYIAKYIMKRGKEGFVHAKRYEKSRGLEPEKIQLFAPLGLTDLMIIRKVQELSAGTMSRPPRWDIYGGFDCMLIETEPPS